MLLKLEFYAKVNHLRLNKINNNLVFCKFRFSKALEYRHYRSTSSFGYKTRDVNL